MPIPHASDLINLSDSGGGNANAGNGATGYNYGNIDYSPSVSVSNHQTVNGAETYLHNGDHVHQDGDWDAGGGGSGGLAQAQNGFLAAITNLGSGGAGGAATSNGSNTNGSGHDTASVTANTVGEQVNDVGVNQAGNIIAGVGGSGGNNNTATGGSVVPILTHTTTDNHTHTSTDLDMTSVTNSLSNFGIDHGHIDLSHIGS